MAREVVGDFEADRLAQQLAFANALRDQGLQGNGGQGYHGGRVYMVGNQLGNIAKMLGGAYMANQAQQGQQVLGEQRDAELQQFLAARPKAFTQTNLEGPTETGEALAPVQTPKPYTQQMQEYGDWAAGGLALHHPLARSLGAHGAQVMGEAPLKLAQMEMQQKEMAQQKELARQQQEAMIRLRGDLALQNKQWGYEHPNVNAPGTVMPVVREDGTIEYQQISKIPGGANAPTGLTPPETPDQRKAREGAESSARAASEGKEIIAGMKGSLENLDKMGALSSSAKGAGSNALSYLKNTEFGQEASRIAGTAEQVERDKFNTYKTNLLLKLKNLEKIGVGSMNSNMELQTYLNSLGNLKMDKTVLDNIQSKFEKIFEQGASRAPAAPRPSALPRATGGFPQMAPQGSNGALTRMDILQNEYRNLDPNSPNYARDKQLLEREMGVAPAAPAAPKPKMSDEELLKKYGG